MQQLLVGELRGNPVITQRGIKLGKLRDVAIDGDSGRVVHFVVRQGRLLASPDLLISPDEIVEITASAIITKDTLIPVSAAIPA